jgi:probable F420-dependent oxidoreductase
MKIRIAVASTNTPAERGTLESLLDGLEAKGFDTLWLSDTPLTPAIEPLLALAVASQRTARLKLGTNVVVPGRNPLALAKELAHLDRLCDGRLLLAFMPGIGSPLERAALGVEGVDRNQRLARVIDLCRAWWAGEAVTAEVGGYRYDAVRVGPPPVQRPLEIWLGGNGPAGLRLTGTHGDGWLGSRATPRQAEANVRAILGYAAEAGREIDGEHFGMSIPYSRSELDDAVVGAVLRGCDAERADILPCGAGEVLALLRRHIDAGVSKFVLRPMTLAQGWEAELDFLGEHALPLQT